jgi:hypothetical protein
MEKTGKSRLEDYKVMESMSVGKPSKQKSLILGREPKWEFMVSGGI